MRLYNVKYNLKFSTYTITIFGILVMRETRKLILEEKQTWYVTADWIMIYCIINTHSHASIYRYIHICKV